MNNPAGGTVEPGQVISLTRRSVWRRDYEMRRGNLSYTKVGRRRIIARQHLQQFLGIAS